MAFIWGYHTHRYSEVSGEPRTVHAFEKPTGFKTGLSTFVRMSPKPRPEERPKSLCGRVSAAHDWRGERAKPTMMTICSVCEAKVRTARMTTRAKRGERPTAWQRILENAS